MALSASTLFEINSAATSGNVNGGGFNFANANMMTDLAATSATGNAPVVTSATYAFVAGDVGHYVFVKAGTDWTPGFYLIASVAGGAATLTATIGTAEQLSTTGNRWIANTVAGCATVASPTGGTFSIDYSRSTASPFASTDIATASSTTLTSATNPFGPNMVGNILHVTAGTGFTAGWYEIVSVSGTTATIDRSIGTHPLTGGTGKVGGAISLGAANDDAVFELAVSSATAATRFFIKGNTTYTLGGTVNIAAAGNAAWQIIIEGYASTRGDRPKGSTRPTIATGANVFSFNGANTSAYCLMFTGTGSSVVTMGSTQVHLHYCKAYNFSTTANRNAFNENGGNNMTFACEGISLRGPALAFSGGTSVHQYFYGHDSNIGVTAGVSPGMLVGCIFAGNVTSAINSTATLNASLGLSVTGCTLYGAENKQGTGIVIASGSRNTNFVNNIIYGFTTGVTMATTNTTHHFNFNDYYNNTTNVSNTNAGVQFGESDQFVDPQFTGIAQRTGSTATTTAGQHLVQTGATFQTWGVTAGRDFVHIKSGTGITVGKYGISSVDSETQITLDVDPGTDATGDKVWQINTGNDFSIGTNLKALGYPGLFPGGLTTGYMDIGAVQRQEAGSSGGMIQSRVRTGM